MLNGTHADSLAAAGRPEFPSSPYPGRRIEPQRPPPGVIERHRPLPAELLMNEWRL